MEADKNPFPKMNICPPPFEGIARAIVKIRGLGSEVELCLSEHIREPQSDDQLALDFPEKKPDAGL